MAAQHGHESEFAPLHDHLERLRTRLDDYQFPPEELSQLQSLLTPLVRS
jgi:hypothetical protein